MFYHSVGKMCWWPKPPKFQILFMAFYFTPWLNPGTALSWRPLEENLVAPHRLQDITHSDIPLKHCKLKFGTNVSHLISVWHLFGKHIFFPQWSQTLVKATVSVHYKTSRNILTYLALPFSITYSSILLCMPMGERMLYISNSQIVYSVHRDLFRNYVVC